MRFRLRTLLMVPLGPMALAPLLTWGQQNALDWVAVWRQDKPVPNVIWSKCLRASRSEFVPMPVEIIEVTPN